MSMPDPIAALKAAVAKAGDNQSEFARRIGTSQQLVSYWLANRRPLPGEFVLRAEAEGFGSRHELRPDLYPVESTRHPADTTLDALGGRAAGAREAA